MLSRLFATFAAWLVLAPLALAQSTAPATPARVAEQVQAQRAWVADAATCPAQAFPQRPVVPAAVDCGSGSQAGACFSRCNSGDASACHQLGQALQKDHGAAAELLHQRACRLGIVSGCTNRAAGLLREKPEDEAAAACAARTLTLGCAADDPWACALHGLNLALGQGVAQDQPKALEMLRKACRKGLADEACVAANRIKDAVLSNEAQAEGAAAPASAPSSR